MNEAAVPAVPAPRILPCLIAARLLAAPANTADVGLEGTQRPCEVRPAWNNDAVRRTKSTLESKEKQLNQSGLGADA